MRLEVRTDENGEFVVIRVAARHLRRRSASGFAERAQSVTLNCAEEELVLPSRESTRASSSVCCRTSRRRRRRQRGASPAPTSGRRTSWAAGAADDAFDERTLVPRDRPIELDARTERHFRRAARAQGAGLDRGARSGDVPSRDARDGRGARRLRRRRRRRVQRRDAAAITEIERGVEGNWVVSRDVLSETWHVAGETRGTLQRVRGEAATLGARLERAATREANARVRADVARRSKAFRALSVTDTYPKEKENDADVVDAIDDIGFAGPRRQKRGVASSPTTSTRRSV